MFQIFKRHQNTSAQLSGSIKVCIIDYPVKLAFIQLSILQITMETSRKLNDEENDFAMNIDTDQEDFLDISEDNADEMQMDSSQASKGSSNFGNKIKGRSLKQCDGSLFAILLIQSEWCTTLASKRNNKPVGSTLVSAHLFKIGPYIKSIASRTCWFDMGSSTTK